VNVLSAKSGQHMIKLKKRKKATPPPKREALTKEGQEANKEGEKELVTPLQVSAPFSQRLKDKSEDCQFARFVQILKRVQINIPFTRQLLKCQSTLKSALY